MIKYLWLAVLTTVCGYLLNTYFGVLTLIALLILFGFGLVLYGILDDFDGN